MSKHRKYHSNSGCTLIATFPADRFRGLVRDCGALSLKQGQLFFLGVGAKSQLQNGSYESFPCEITWERVDKHGSHSFHSLPKCPGFVAWASRLTSIRSIWSFQKWKNVPLDQRKMPLNQTNPFLNERTTYILLC